MNPRWTQRNPRLAWLAAVAIILLLDQTTKSYFSNALKLGERILVTDWFNFVHLLNTGAAFSLLADAGGWQRWFFIAVSVLVVGGVSVVCLAQQAEPLDRWMGAFVVGGGGGNLVDRIQTGAVVDFLDIHWRDIHWPAFNLADIFIVCAALTWCLASLKAPPRPPKHKNPKDLSS
ncbi:signal peptidase II [Hydrogenophaga crassostreae]|uniref:Lipoprotein signal peptidase n=1 Tax=Hydrogenophaga crassostreae TaxID=1763535 RepID=A0A1D8NWB1_9BURK|nr:signal peptidase II [Hydrogenophaga crassostreae]AOW13387.1 signal peptidase II [Hydrogenophaga crassostreae]